MTTYLTDACPEENGHSYCQMGSLELGEGTFCSKDGPFTESTPRLPGSGCTQNSDCISNKCDIVNKVGSCSGESAAGLCTHSNQCNVGLYCDTGNGVCSKTCSASELCDPRYACTAGKCQMWFKGTIGESVSSTDGRVCETGYMNDGVCSTGLKRLNTKMISNKPESGVCVYEDASGASVSEKQDSVCSMSSNPASYCKIGAEDDEFKTILKLMMDNPDCVKWSVNYNQWYVLTGSYPEKPKPIVPPTPTPPTPPKPEGAMGRFVQGIAVLVVVSLMTLI